MKALSTAALRVTFRVLPGQGTQRGGLALLLLCCWTCQQVWIGRSQWARTRPCAPGSFLPAMACPCGWGYRMLTLACGRKGGLASQDPELSVRSLPFPRGSSLPCQAQVWGRGPKAGLSGRHCPLPWTWALVRAVRPPLCALAGWWRREAIVSPLPNSANPGVRGESPGRPKTLPSPVPSPSEVSSCVPNAPHRGWVGLSRCSVILDFYDWDGPVPMKTYYTLHTPRDM